MTICKEVICSTLKIKLQTNQNHITITRVPGKTNISGYLVIDLNLGQEVIL